MLTRAAALLYRSRSPVFFCVRWRLFAVVGGDDRLEMLQQVQRRQRFRTDRPRAARRPARARPLDLASGARAQCLRLRYAERCYALRSMNFVWDPAKSTGAI